MKSKKLMGSILNIFLIGVGLLIVILNFTVWATAEFYGRFLEGNYPLELFIVIILPIIGYSLVIAGIINYTKIRMWLKLVLSLVIGIILFCLIFFLTFGMG